MANNNQDYGYFGKGDMGYAQYMTAFNRNHGGGGGGGGNNGGCGPGFFNACFVVVMVLWVISMILSN